LFGLYRRKYLRSGAPANDDRVTEVILHGRGMMPAMGNSMDEEQLAELLAYLHTL
jgi:mono/diheme cytochrome c family protein